MATLGARDFSSAVSEDVSAFGQTPKIPAAREKNLWYPGYPMAPPRSKKKDTRPGNAGTNGQYFLESTFERGGYGR